MNIKSGDNKITPVDVEHNYVYGKYDHVESVVEHDTVDSQLYLVGSG